MSMFNILSATNQLNSPVFWSIMAFGWVGTVVAIFAFLPQSLKTIKSRKTKGVSLITFIIYTLANTLWYVWGILDLVYNGQGNTVVTLKDSIIIITNIPCALWAGIILSIKVYNIYAYGEDCKKWVGKKNKK